MRGRVSIADDERRGLELLIEVTDPEDREAIVRAVLAVSDQLGDFFVTATRFEWAVKAVMTGLHQIADPGTEPNDVR